MNKRVLAGGTAVALAATMGVGVAGTAQAGSHNKPLAKVLDTGGFDRANDYDVVSQAVLAVLKDDPSSPVSLLTKGKKRATAFLPDDAAFKRLASALSGKQIRSEKRAFTIVAGLGLDTVEQVLLLHVVPGATITGQQALDSNGAKLQSAQGDKLKVIVRTSHSNKRVVIKDLSKTSSNARVVVADINAGNKQIAHGINNVLLPKGL